MKTIRSALVVALITSWPLSAQNPARDLSGVLARALEVHPSVAAAEAATERADAALAVARSAYLPTLGVDGGVTQFQEPMLVAPLHRFDPTSVPDFDETLMRGTLGASYTLFDGGRRGADAERARAVRAGTVAGRREVEAILLERTAQAYLAVLTAREVLAAQGRREEALAAETARARRLLDEGAAPRLELLRAEAELAAVRADGEAARRGLELALATLGRLIDVAPAELRDAPFADPGLPLSDPPPALPTDPASEQALAAAPTVIQAEAAVRAADAGADAARSAWLPSVSAALGYSFFAGGGVDAVAEWQAGLQISYPLFTGGARRGAVAAAAADAARARADTRVVRERAAQSADAARTAEIEARSRVVALEAAVTGFDELARVERLALDEGAGIQSDWLRAEAGLFQARAGLADAGYSVLRARLAWARAVGRLDLDFIDSLLEMTP